MKLFNGFLIWIMVASGSAAAMQQASTARLKRPQPTDIRLDHDVHVENWRMREILLYLLRGTGLHGGVVEMSGCSDPPRGHLRIGQGLTVRQAMDALVDANPGYQWDLKDGVVDLMPKGGAPLLRTKIAKFQMNGTDRDGIVAIGKVLDLPEVRDRQAALGLKPGMSGIGLFAGEVHPIPRKPVPVKINLRNVSILEVFNRIVKAFPNAAWIYHESDCNGAKSFTVDLASDR